ncbi:hypothetical protein BDW66DRAFT_156345 [Aspergillus desertorum]
MTPSPQLPTRQIQSPAETETSQWLIANPRWVSLGCVEFLSKGENIAPDRLLISCRLWICIVGLRSLLLLLMYQLFLLNGGSWGLFFDYSPSTMGRNKLGAPFVGNWSAISAHNTLLNEIIAQKTGEKGYLSGAFEETDRYLLLQATPETSRLTFSNGLFSTARDSGYVICIRNKSTNNMVGSVPRIRFICRLDKFRIIRRRELQRHIILSKYLHAVNSAGKDPPQDSGPLGASRLLGALEQVGSTASLSRRMQALLPSPIERAEEQRCAGARLGKMSGPSGTTAPGPRNALLIWQQPNPMFFVELERRSFLLDELVTWVVSYAWWNAPIKVCDLGPPMYTSSENATRPSKWLIGVSRIPAPESWTGSLHNLAPLPTVHGAYSISADLPDMWTNTAYTADHLSQIAGFPAMASLRLGDVNQAVGWLLDSHFQFDDIGDPIDTVVPTPYFPARSALLLTIAMMAAQ